ncbi:hypothetical protein JHK82_041667 [Glycine max]|nr:hypothetical protein JHK86_041721 [Glycine max]KAG4955954.1 hypothetical protein JHK85_042334 [Glycine max]KAG5104697.1 hypothetical protein JHK82_041667 [Glycine max]KAG5115823.1 hypothetical protein JHK84_041936 [Glycine max]
MTSYGQSSWPCEFLFLSSTTPPTLLSPLTQLAINFSGPKRVKDEKTRFSSILVSNHPSGGTTLSASGMLVPDTLCDAQVAGCLYGDNCEDRVLVVTVASVVEPFLSPQQRDNIPQVDIPASSNCLQSLIEASLGLPEHEWEVGCIANCYPPHSSDGSLLMADIRCLPGMEGSPVFSEHACLIGVLIRPLRQKTYGEEIQLVIPWDAIVTASSSLLRKRPQNTQKGNIHKHLYFGSSSPLPIEKAMTSVCLVTIGDGVWASGVLLNSQGLILTNAHLLEPWRFGKEHVNGGGYGTNSERISSMLEGTAYLVNRVASNQVSQTSPLKMPILYPFAANEQGGYKSSPTYDNHRNIRVRLDHIKPWVWCYAKVVYVCKGPWDVALLQLESVPDNLLPITMNFSRPSTGSQAFVIGHGLFGPKRGFFPSVCSGVVAKVVEAKTPQSYLSIQPEHLHNHEHFPAMLETTATIHPGASGGAVINSDGHMIGLVTSNARHSGGAVIPHLNFSIPSAALAPVFKFSKAMQDLSLLRILDEPNEYLSSVWALMRPSYPNPHPMHDPPQSVTDNKNKEKGSRFAKVYC